MSETPKVTLASVLRNPVYCLAFGFGSGTAPKAPGTFGTLAAVPIWLLLSQLPLVWYSVVVILTAVVGIWLCGKAAEDLKVHDHPGIVWDEMVGYWITMWAAPAGWYWPILGFALFRLFDIWKPWPISVADKKVKGGTGIMLDDLLAGLIALAGMQLAYYWFA